MRFYNLILTDPKSGNIYQPTQDGNGFTLGSGPSTFTSLSTSTFLSNLPVTNPAALNIEFDFPAAPEHVAQGATWIRVWGVGLGMIGQAANLNGAQVQLYAGMGAGLPFATTQALQQGLILNGTVWQGYGNWQGTNQTLELVLTPPAAAAIPPNLSNLNFYWAAGQPMASALALLFKQAFPNLKANINVGPALILSNTEQNTTANLQQMAQYINRISLKVGTPTYGVNYPGVTITVTDTTVTALDGTFPATKTTPLNFVDLIGQPTWIGPGLVTWKTVLRADLSIGDQISFPIGIQSPYALTGQSAAVPGGPSASQTAFQGAFAISEIHHYANFRQPDADSWNTTFVGYPIGLSAALAQTQASGFGG